MVDALEELHSLKVAAIRLPGRTLSPTWTVPCAPAPSLQQHGYLVVGGLECALPIGSAERGRPVEAAVP